jgi:hypothetical protein
MADLVDLTTLPLGTNVSFTCVHPSDQTVYEGKIIGRGTYSLVRAIEGDLVPYYREVAKTLTSMAPYTELTYLTLEYQQDGQVMNVVRAIEWIAPASVKVINPKQSFNITVYNREKEIDGQTVIDLLQSHGFVAGYPAG